VRKAPSDGARIERVVDALTGTYSLSCPHVGAARIRLSSFRLLERLPGAAHPAVYAIRFDCGCGDEHPALLPHDELDWAPLGLGLGTAFINLMTGRTEDVAAELTDQALRRLGAGEWPWTFYCSLEERARPVTPSAFSVITPGGDAFALAVRCPACGTTSVNVVSRDHVDVPFWNDAHVGVIRHVFAEDALRTIEQFRAELASASFDPMRLELER
jgi:hypothetical protein